MANSCSESPPFSGGESQDSEFATRACADVREMIGAGMPPREILCRLAIAGEKLAGPGTSVSILVLDKNGLLRDGASPSLPHDYLKAIDGLKPNALVGTCAAAAATGRVVVTPDFSADDKWAELRHLPHALGFLGAWSCPIKNTCGTVLGTFGTYFRNRRSPSPGEQKGVALLAAAAALVLEAYECQPLR